MCSMCSMCSMCCIDVSAAAYLAVLRRSIEVKYWDAVLGRRIEEQY